MKRDVNGGSGWLGGGDGDAGGGGGGGGVDDSFLLVSNHDAPVSTFSYTLPFSTYSFRFQNSWKAYYKINNIRELSTLSKRQEMENVRIRIYVPSFRLYALSFTRKYTNVHLLY